MERTKKLIDPYDLTIHLAKKNAKHPLQYDDVLAVIADEKRVDAVEVVRCKDCKHYVAPQGTYVCDCFEGLNFATDNDFCSNGERREGESNGKA